jgi:hypothetical protein
MENQNEQKTAPAKGSARRVWGWILLIFPLLGIYNPEKVQRFLNDPMNGFLQ